MVQTHVPSLLVLTISRTKTCNTSYITSKLFQEQGVSICLPEVPAVQCLLACTIVAKVLAYKVRVSGSPEQASAAPDRALPIEGLEELYSQHGSLLVVSLTVQWG